MENKWIILKNFLLQNLSANINQTWRKVSLGEGYISLLKWRATHISKGDNYKIAKILKSSSKEPLGQFQPNLAKSIPG